MATQGYIRIIGEIAEVVEERIGQRVSVKKLAELLVADQLVSTPVLPPGCRIYRGDDKNNIHTFVIEQPPTLRNVTWNTSNLDNSVGPVQPRFRLAFPYMIFVIRTSGVGILNHGCQLFCRKEPIKTKDDVLFAPPLPNTGGIYRRRSGVPIINNGCVICTGDMRIRSNDSYIIAADFVNSFWQAAFNDDLSQNYYDFIGDNMNTMDSLNRWQELSKENQLFILGLNYRTAGTISEVLAWPGI